MWLEFALFVIIICIGLLVFEKSREEAFYKEHLLITGGSSGIGLALAIEAASRGASITLVARNQKRLEDARDKVLTCVKSPEQKVLMFAADVTEGPESLEDLVKEAEKTAGPITYLLNCAGTSISGRLEETSVEDSNRMLNVNYLGSVYMTKVVLPYMKSRKQGRVVFVSSLAGLFGLYGYSAYSASKFALVGMAQALRMEVAPYGISVTISFPPDTDTPGFAEEEKSKLLETRLICESGGLYKASTVAVKTLKDAMNKRFLSSVGFEGWMLCTLCCGCSASSIAELLMQVLCMGALRLIVYFYLRSYDRIAKECTLKREKEGQHS